MTYRALPEGLFVQNSPVAGQGIFTRYELTEGKELGMSHYLENGEIYRTPLGGFLNHSINPNCVKYPIEQDWGVIYHMKTIKPIKKGEELFLKYTFYSVV